MRVILHALAALALLGCAGCVWVPDHGTGSLRNRRGEIADADRALLAPGVSRGDVLCELGQPDWISPDETRFVYWTREVSSWMYIYAIGDAVVLLWGTDHYLLFEFHPRGTLAAQREVADSFFGWREESGPNTELVQTLLAGNAPAK